MVLIFLLADPSVFGFVVVCFYGFPMALKGFRMVLPPRWFVGGRVRFRMVSNGFVRLSYGSRIVFSWFPFVFL